MVAGVKARNISTIVPDMLIGDVKYCGTSLVSN
jgi:hypothetical protein